MFKAPLHTWDLTPAQARALQGELARRVDTSSSLTDWELVAAADASYDRGDQWLYAAVVVTRAPTFEVVARAGLRVPLAFPYVPGLLSFREAPGLVAAFEKLDVRPDVVLCDGQGTAHPRRFGLACHLGLWLDLPTIGCAKSILCGEFGPPGPNRGDWSPLIDEGETVGAALRTRPRVQPVFVSPGHKCDLASAVAVVLAATTKYRLPDPARLAHEFSNDLRRDARGTASPT